jgi:predicted GIY-YIG superfamily endonuclease
VTRFAGLAHSDLAKQDALRSFSEEGPGVYYVYLIKSLAKPDERYVGSTDDLRERIAGHNAGRSSHTAKYKPWELVTYVAFSTRTKAERFELYLKSGSGHAFANKRLW